MNAQAPQTFSQSVQGSNSWTQVSQVVDNFQQLCEGIFTHTSGDPSTVMESSAGAGMSAGPSPSNANTHALMASQQSAANDARFRQQA